MRRFFFCIVFLLFLLVSPVSAATYYASPTGSGSTCSLESPCSFDTGISKLQAGDTLYLRGGNYLPGSEISFYTDGTSENRITISGYPGENATINGNNAMPNSAYNALFTVKGDYVTLRDVNIINSFGAGVFLTGNYDYGINIDLNHIGQTGIAIIGTGDLLDGCTCTDNGWRYWTNWSVGTWGSAICAAGSNSINGTIQNCISHGNTGEGFNSYAGATGTIIQDNIAYDNGVNYYADSTTNAIYRRNIGYYIEGGPEGKASYNFYVGAETSQPNNLVVINNFLLGGSPNFVVGSQVTGNPVITVVYNTFVNAVNT